MDKKPLIIHPQRPHLLAVLFVSALAAWLAMAALPPEPVTGPMPGRASSGSQYPAPQVDESSPAAEPPPTF